MKNTKKLLALILTFVFMLSAATFAAFNVSAAAPTATCTVEVAGYNAGTQDYYIAADVTFESDKPFTAGLFAIEAQGLKFTECTVADAVGGAVPEIYADYDLNKVIFTGFDDSANNDFRSYTKLTLTLKFTEAEGAQIGTEYTVIIKDINISNYDEEKYVTANAQGTLEAQHVHTAGDSWEKDATDHWKVCTGCGETFDKAEHTYDTAVTAPTCTEGGYTTYTCTVCGYSYTGDETAATGHTLGDWLSDEENHWKVCSECAAIVDSAAHTASDWITDIEATAEAAGHKYKECTVCGRVLEEEEIPKLIAHVPGDINGDGVLNNKDLTRFFQYLSDWDVEVNEDALDVNGDGNVNNKDLTRLFQYLSDWDVEIC